jgi:8-oxo-dGTP diphosphatase
MRRRNSSRLIVLDQNNKILLFRFKQKHEVPACNSFWATPGGEIEYGETAQQAAQREIYEEVGLSVDISTLGGPVWHNEFVFRTFDDEEVYAYESFFVVRIANNNQMSCANWTQLEREIILEYKWWSTEQLQMNIAKEVIYPENLVGLLKQVMGKVICYAVN